LNTLACNPAAEKTSAHRATATAVDLAVLNMVGLS
jgi:hypothetical protein